MSARDFAAFTFLIAIGSLQMLGDLLDLPALRGFGAATQLAPAMKVFTAHRGYETHAARFHVGWRDGSGQWVEQALSPALYGNVDGPYNRRNVYGAALAYGPLLRADARGRAMQASVMHYAFCEPASMRAALRIPPDTTRLRVRVEPVRTLRPELDYSWEIDCGQ